MTEKVTNKNRSQLSFRLDENLKNEFVGKVKRRGDDVQRVLCEFVDRAVEAEDFDTFIEELASVGARGKRTPELDTPEASRKHSLESSSHGTAISLLSNSPWHDMLDRILASKHRPAIEAIVRNLHAFDILVDADAKGRDDAYTVPLLPEEVAEFYPDIAKTIADLEEAKREDREGTAKHSGRDRTRSGRRAG
jgi:hypothetical protein